MSTARAAGLALGFAADRAFGDPARWHPVSGFGRAGRGLERRMYAPSRLRGAAFAGILVAGPAGLGLAAGRACRGRPVAEAVTVALATWTVLGGTTLAREARAVETRLARGDLTAARARVTRLVGRDSETMAAADVARAAIESVAENTSDAVVAPLFWGALLGPAGLLGYRAVNTLDAMVGHRSVRYERFGWASARLDDAANLAPARLTALLAALCGADPAGALRAWRRDARRHPSPNAGPVEAAFAGALGVRLGGVNAYRGVVEDRGTLGDGRTPEAADIGRTERLAARVGAAALGVSALGVSALGVSALGVSALGGLTPP
ncbi:cobalamin biosynthesis protein [Tomitella cavernea]|uniref:Cobalamin biosynthesis protein CobD n=1 Tax=Tomitella cavernea TaxID=1387982 RepID=A0ABP9CXH2_9ACTN|nr:cobalamin biosynthesis protein [Tomitella cavernea]